jgi:signal transduction histidine kinase
MSSRLHKRFWKSTGVRLTLWYFTVFAFSSLLLFSLAYFLISSATRERDRKTIQSKLEEYVLQYKTGGLDALKDELRLEGSANEQSGLFVRLADSRHRTLFLTLPDRWRGVDISSLERLGRKGEVHQVFLKDQGEEDVLEITGHRLPGGLILQIGKGSEEREKLLERFREIFIGISIPLILLGLIGGSFLAYRALHPIRDLIRAIGGVNAGQMETKVPTKGTGDELDELVQCFNGMIEKIRTLILGMKEALDNVAHDLNTPLTSMRGAIEMVLQSEPDANALREALMDCAEESEQLSKMVKTLLDVTEAEAGMMTLHYEEFDVLSLINNVADIYDYIAEDKGVELLLMLPEQLHACVDPDRIRQVIANLVDNAIKYTPAGGKVRVEACRKNGAVMVAIEDNGVGIPTDDIPRIFDRLYRSDKSRSHRGLGLGLSLVRAVVQAHAGHIEVESSPGKGSRFTFVLPARHHG